MKEKSIQQAQEIIRKRDERKFNDRVKRLLELGTISLDYYKREPPSLLDPYLEEAAETFLENCYRSCIFCCSATIEQVFKHEILLTSDNPEKTQKKIQGLTFGKLINYVEKERIPQLQPILKDAKWLNRLRNAIAVHPRYISFYRKDDTKEEREWKNKILKQSIENILKFLKPKERRKIMEYETIIHNNKVKFKELINNPSAYETFIIWSSIENELLHYLALKAHKTMKKIIETLYHSS